MILLFIALTYFDVVCRSSSVFIHDVFDQMIVMCVCECSAVAGQSNWNCKCVLSPSLSLSRSLFLSLSEENSNENTEIERLPQWCQLKCMQLLQLHICHSFPLMRCDSQSHHTYAYPFLIWLERSAYVRVWLSILCACLRANIRHIAEPRY